MERHEYRLGDVCTLRAGSAFKKKYQGLSDGDLPFIKVSDMNLPANQFRIHEANNWVSHATAQDIGARSFPAGTVVFAKIGEALKQNRVRLLTVPTLIDNNMMGAIPTRDLADPYYLMLALATTGLDRWSTGTAMPYLTQGTLNEVPIELPDLRTQRRVAAVVGAYDSLIENNLRRIAILEEMAQTVYREWFVNFRFPGHEDVAFVDSPLGPIPEGWQVSTLGKESSVVMGQSPKSEFYNDDGIGLPFHQGVTHFGMLFPKHVRYCTVESRIAEAGDTLVSVRAPVGRINVADTRMVIGRGLAAVRSLDDECPGFHYRQTRNVFREEDSMGGGTIYKAITKGDLVGVHWLLPPSEIRAAFDVLERPLFALTANLTRQIRNLRVTRDLLLPKLVSGEIDVSDLEIDTDWLAS